jgi:N-acetylglucosamine kinase-like BadF-type ATPase
MTVVGVDGGTTKTIALVADHQGEILGAARGSGSNWTGENVDIPMAVVVETVRKALDQAHVAQADLGVFCLAGADWPEDHTRRANVLASANIARQVVVKNDSFGGLRAGTHQPYGIIIAAGTGMNTAVITPDGREWAFGYYQTDGGASDIARQAFIAVLRGEDGRGQPTLLTGLALDRLGFPSVEAMLRARVARQIPEADYLSLCPLVFEAAYQGDEVACAIIEQQGLILAGYATALIRRFDMQKVVFDVVLAGSVFKGRGPLLVDTITQAVHHLTPLPNIVRAQFEPVVGSLLLAYDALGNPVTEALLNRLSATQPGTSFFDTANGAGFSPHFTRGLR